MTVEVLLVVLAAVLLAAHIENRLKPWPAILCLILLEALRILPWPSILCLVVLAALQILLSSRSRHGADD